MADTEVKPCDGCGASVYPEHIGAQKAGYWRGQLFCVHCFAEHRQAQITIGPDDFAGSVPSEAQAVEDADDAAAVLSESTLNAGKKVAAVLSGGNIDRAVFLAALDTD